MTTTLTAPSATGSILLKDISAFLAEIPLECRAPQHAELVEWSRELNERVSDKLAEERT